MHSLIALNLVVRKWLANHVIMAVMLKLALSIWLKLQGINRGFNSVLSALRWISLVWVQFCHILLEVTEVGSPMGYSKIFVKTNDNVVLLWSYFSWTTHLNWRPVYQWETTPLANVQEERTVLHLPKTRKRAQIKAQYSICEKDIIHEKDDSIFCEGTCQAWLHRCCAGISKQVFTILSKSGSNDLYFCSYSVAQYKKEIHSLWEQVSSLSKELSSLKASCVSSVEFTSPQSSANTVNYPCLLFQINQNLHHNQFRK